MELKSEQHIPSKSAKGSDSNREKAPRPYVHDPMEWDKYLYADISGDVLKACELDMENLKAAMEVSNRSEDKITVIVGEQGYGKTFLARRIFNQLRDSFHCCAWVNVSRKDKPYDVLRSVVEKVTGKSSLMPNAKRTHPESMREMLCEALYNKSYFIVLDDVHDSTLLWPVWSSLPDATSGGHLLITAQEEPIASGFSVRLGTLREAEMKALIKSKSEIVGRASTDLSAALIDKCGGLPLRVNLLSGLIAKSSDHKDELIERIPDNLNDLFAYCYNYMRGELKPCFLYMTLFPKSHAIPVMAF